jgi:hypothetical protein
MEEKKVFGFSDFDVSGEMILTTYDNAYRDMLMDIRVYLPGGKIHPQVCAPGFVMYTCWMIRHLDGNPWTNRVDDRRYTWLYDHAPPDSNAPVVCKKGH